MHLFINENDQSIKNYRLRISRIVEDQLLNKIQDSKPKILQGESRILNDFGIDNNVYVMSLQLTTNGNYSVQSTLVIQNKNSVVKFYKDIGFSFTKKQTKLKDALICKGWLNSDIEVLQHTDTTS